MITRLLRIFAIILLIITSGYFRLSNLKVNSEFLGDQGVAASVMYGWATKGTVPLTGPETSVGIKPGPAFYYLLYPGYVISGMRPEGMAIPMAVLGIGTTALLFFLISSITNPITGFVVSFAYAVSPVAVSQNRAIWNPAPIPFFTVLGWYALFRITKGSHRWAGILGISLAVLVQLHFTNVYQIFVYSFVFGYMAWRNGIRSYIRPLAYIILAAGIVLLPYVYYESGTGFADVKELVQTFFTSHPRTALSSTYRDGLNLFFGLFERMYPFGDSWVVKIATLGLLAFGFLGAGKWGKFFSSWYVFGILPVLVYSGGVYEHYVYHLSLVPYVVTGLLLFLFHSGARIPERFRNRLSYVHIFKRKNVDSGVHPIKVGVSQNDATKMFSTCLVIGIFGCILAYLPWTRMEYHPKSYGDIPRTEEIVNEMIRRSNGQPFSFTLLSTRSFSDYHYRYYFLTKNVMPSSIYGDDYGILFLVCENEPCFVDHVREKKPVAVICYDMHCNPTYPDKRLDGWSLESVKPGTGGATLLTLKNDGITGNFDTMDSGR